MTMLLQTYGPWSMCAILIFGIVALYRTMLNLLEKRNDQFLEVFKECNTLLTQISDSHERIEALMRENKEKWEEVRRVYDRLERAADRRRQG